MDEKYNEPLLDDDYPIHRGYWYLVNGEPLRAGMTGTCLAFKRALERYKNLPGAEIRRCDAVKRKLPLQW